MNYTASDQDRFEFAYQSHLGNPIVPDWILLSRINCVLGLDYNGCSQPYNEGALTAMMENRTRLG